MQDSDIENSEDQIAVDPTISDRAYALALAFLEKKDDTSDCALSTAKAIFHIYTQTVEGSFIDTWEDEYCSMLEQLFEPLSALEVINNQQARIEVIDKLIGLISKPFPPNYIPWTMLRAGTPEFKEYVAKEKLEATHVSAIRVFDFTNIAHDIGPDVDDIGATFVRTKLATIDVYKDGQLKPAIVKEFVDELLDCRTLLSNDPYIIASKECVAKHFNNDQLVVTIDRSQD